MFKSLLRDRLLLFLLSASILIKIFSLRPVWVERYYTYGFYPLLSRLWRFLLGWMPFSFGDVLYIGATVYLLVKLVKFIRILIKRQARTYLSPTLFRKVLKLVLGIYLLFNLCWGLNYDRLGIAAQLELDVRTYSKTELLQLTQTLQQKLNAVAVLVDTTQRSRLDRNRTLFDLGIRDYKAVSGEYGFLSYYPPSIKPSLFSVVGHYFGFSGYLNPFTGEAQINTTEPDFTKPFVLNHEIAHQLGYGKENEASFVSFLASRRSAVPDVRYSLYYELYFNAFSELAQTRDTALLNGLRKGLAQRVVRDRIAERAFRLRRQNRMQPYVSDFYDNYLKANNQPKGLATYDEVTSWLIAYMKKNGAVAL